MNFVITGDSHTLFKGAYVDTPDLRWCWQLAAYLTANGVPNTFTNLGIGGTEIVNCMPTKYVSNPAPNALLNIDAVEALNPDLVLLSMSGNHFANGRTLDSVKYCFQYVIDRLKAMRTKFIITSTMPRNQYFPGLAGADDAAKTIVYNGIRDDFDAWLKASWPDNVVDVWDAINPDLANLLYDNLHFKPAGQTILQNLHTNNPVFQSCVMPPAECNVALTAGTGNINITGHLKCSQYSLFYQDTDLSWVKIYSGGDTNGNVNVDVSFAGSASVWKVEVWGKDKITRKIIT